MKAPGHIALTPFPHTDLSGSKLRPVLLLCPASARFDDWVVCMVSSQLHQAEVGLDEVVQETDADYLNSGLHAASVIRLSRLAVLQGSLMAGRLGAVSADRLEVIRLRLARWIEAGGQVNTLPDAL